MCISQSVTAQIFPHRLFLGGLRRYILTGDPYLHFFYFYFCIRLRELHHQRSINKRTICPSRSPSCLLTSTHALQRKNTERDRETFSGITSLLHILIVMGTLSLNPGPLMALLFFYELLIASGFRSVIQNHVGVSRLHNCRQSSSPRG